MDLMDPQQSCIIRISIANDYIGQLRFSGKDGAGNTTLW